MSAQLPIVLYLDRELSRSLMRHLVQRCHEAGAALVCLAPPPGPLAIARLEPHLGALEAAGIDWRVWPASGDIIADIAALPAARLLVCAEGSALADLSDNLPAPLLILLNPPPASPLDTAEPGAVNWLASSLHRGI